MHDWAFQQCCHFLENRIIESPENVEFIKAYVSLIEHKSKFDTAFFSQDAEIQKNWHNNQTQMHKNWQDYISRIGNSGTL